MNAKSTIISSLLSIFALLMLTLCSPRKHSQHPLTVAVSIPPQAEILRHIAGDSIHIVTIMRSDANPETFEPSVATMRAIHDADLILTIGCLPFETILTDRIHRVNPSLKIVATSDSIDLIYGTHHHHHSHGPISRHDDHDLDDDLAPDPHTWSSPSSLRIIASAMLSQLIELDPARADFYTARHRKLDLRLDSLDRALSDKLAPVAGRKFLVWHPFLSYFARDYGLNQEVIGRENKELSVKSLHQRLSEAASDSIDIILIQESLDSRQAINIASQLGASITPVNPLSPDYEQQFNIITDAITASSHNTAD